MAISYRRTLLSTLLHAIVYVLHNLLNVQVQIANEMGLQKNIEQNYEKRATDITKECTVWQKQNFVQEYSRTFKDSQHLKHITDHCTFCFVFYLFTSVQFHLNRATFPVYSLYIPYDYL
jgi:hypothetical protein